jgi:hypothetical protein
LGAAENAAASSQLMLHGREDSEVLTSRRPGEWSTGTASGTRACGDGEAGEASSGGGCSMLASIVEFEMTQAYGNLLGSWGSHQSGQLPNVSMII